MNSLEVIRVWAPAAKDVRVQLNGREIEMTPSDNGWWQVEAPGPLHGTSYAFVLDGGTPLPDPRSPSQPLGVHGHSCFIDHNLFAWNDDGWRPPLLRSAVIYELHIGTFTPEGTFASAIDRLDHLVELGITHIEIMPVAEFPGDRGWGYDGVDLYAPHHAYGGSDGLKRLVDACHRKGIAVILDVVYNHLGPEGNYLWRFGPYFSHRHKTPWGPSINFDGEASIEVRRFLCDNALMWLRDYHFDGLRLDAVHEMFDTSAVHILEQLATEVDQLQGELGRSLILIAESDLNDPRVVRSREAAGYGMSAQWSDDLHHSLHACLTGERQGYYADFGSMEDVKTALENTFVYSGRYSVFRKRCHGRPATGVPRHRFVVCLQNHDQIGNRAKGDRITHLVGTKAVLTGAAVVLTSAAVPMLFQGEEWGARTPFQYFTAHESESLARAVSDGRRNEFSAFGWAADDVPDPQAESTFQNSKLDWSEIDREPHSKILNWYTKLIRLRRSTLNSLNNVSIKVDIKDSMLQVVRGNFSLICKLDRDTASATLRVGGEVVAKTGRASEWQAGAGLNASYHVDCAEQI
jgi:maltooligosyltrehalose trehalohydrolase